MYVRIINQISIIMSTQEIEIPSKLDKYKSKWLMPFDNRFTIRTEKEWFDRYMILASEEPD